MPTLLSRPALHALLHPADNDDVCDVCMAAENTDDLSLRSDSFESVPSLEVDDASQASLSSPSSPLCDIRRPGPTSRKEKPVTPVPAEDCGLDHPLLPPPALSDDNDEQLAFLTPPPNTGHDRSKNSKPLLLSSSSSLFSSSSSSSRQQSLGFKSSLTASLRMLRSAARSFSNFTATFPVVQADDFLARSILSISPHLTDDRWPLSPPLLPHSDSDVPTPALRRYLNPPLPPARSPDIGCSQQRRQHGTPVHGDDIFTASIQLQTYHVSQPDGRISPLPASSGSSAAAAASASARTKSSSVPLSSRHSRQEASSLGRHNRSIAEAAVAGGGDGCGSGIGASSSSNASLQSPAFARSREPRENSQFLRVVVLEMNMRRSGKLSDTAPGRARFVLPPRKSSPPPSPRLLFPSSPPSITPSLARKEAIVPARWISWTIDV
jgi:hypothetical protein